MDQDILNTILKDTFSITQFKHRVGVLKHSLLKALFGGDDENASPAPQDLNWLKSLPLSFYQKFNKDNVYNILSEIEEEVAKLPTLTLYLTFELDEVNLANLGAFIREKFGPTMILDIKFDPNLIAGAALVWKGIYRDYSLRTTIEKRKAEVLENFKRFLR